MHEKEKNAQKLKEEEKVMKITEERVDTPTLTLKKVQKRKKNITEQLPIVEKKN